MARRIKYTPQLSMSFVTMEEEIVDRSSSRGVSQVSENQSGLLNGYNTPIHPNKIVKIYG